MVLKTCSDIVLETCSDMKWKDDWIYKHKQILLLKILVLFSCTFSCCLLYNHCLLYGTPFTCRSKLHHTIHLSCHFLNRIILYESHTFLLLVSKFSICRSHPYSRICINKKVDALCVVFIIIMPYHWHFAKDTKIKGHALDSQLFNSGDIDIIITKSGPFLRFYNSYMHTSLRFYHMRNLSMLRFPTI